MQLSEMERATATSDAPDVAPPVAPTPRAGLGQFFVGRKNLVVVAQLGLFLLGLVGFLYLARPFFLPVILALLLALLFKPVVRDLAQHHVPNGLSAALVLVILLTGIVVALTRASEPALEWIEKAPGIVHQMELKVNRVLGFMPKAPTWPAVQGGAAVPSPEKPTPRIQFSGGSLPDTLFIYTKSFLAGFIECLVLLYFLLASGDLFMLKLVRILPTLHDKKQAVEIVREVEGNISNYLLTVTVINACLGIVVGVAMLILRMPNPFLWGLMAALLNFIPYLGPLMGVIIFSLVALLSFETRAHVILPPLVYLGLHGIEANFITPTVLGHRLTLNPVVIFTSIIFWTWLWGIPGALLAVPMLMMLKIVCDHFHPLAPISEFLSG